MSATRVGYRSRPLRVSRYSCRCRSPSAWYGTRQRMPWSTRVASRSVSTARGAPRLRWKSANRRTPRNASRSTRRLHFSPTTASVPATEQRVRSHDASISDLASLADYSIGELSSLDDPGRQEDGSQYELREATMELQLAPRPVQPDDLPRFYALWPRLSRDTVYRRFHSPVHKLPAETVRRLVEVDHDL